MQFPLNTIPIEYNSHGIKMCYSIELRERRYVKDYGFLSFAKTVGKNLSKKYGQKLVDRATKSATDPLKLLAIEQFKKQLK